MTKQSQLRKTADEILAEWHQAGPPLPYGEAQKRMAEATVQRARLIRLVDLVRDAVDNRR